MTYHYEDVADVGDIIKAYDVPPLDGMPERYLIGIVQGKGRVFQLYGERNIFLGEGYTVEIIGGDKKSVLDKGRKGTEAFVPYNIEYADHENRVSVLITLKERELAAQYIKENPDWLNTHA